MPAELSRRAVLGFIAAGAMMTIDSTFGGEVRKIGLQLYTVRDLLKVDLRGP
ncbi:hypothetical protein ABIB90_007057 [Bradyrhizobium sp. JR4.1]|uniref:hypothetical protein n=1 Tax=Bradyrhizobium sp. JR4.1 TaxID=3156372 RepID=UPI0033929B00